jgi:CheY-like chemotaxis protein
LLQLRGFDVVAVPDGGAALSALLASFRTTAGLVEEALSAHNIGEAVPQMPSGQPFDLALLDMNMPVLSGPQTTAAFREWEKTARPGCMRLPIAALTANVHETVRGSHSSPPLAVLHLPRPFQCSTPLSASPRGWCGVACAAGALQC